MKKKDFTVLGARPEFVKAATASRVKRPFRSLKIRSEKLESSDGFTDLHTKSCEEVLKGNGFGLNSGSFALRREVILDDRLFVFSPYVDLFMSCKYFQTANGHH